MSAARVLAGRAGFVGWSWHGAAERSPRGRRVASIAAGLLLSGAVLGAAAAESEIPWEIQRALERSNCTEAVDAVEKAMHWRQPSGYLVAGWMSERGWCLKKDIDKAFAFYEQAQRAGSRSAALRLVGLSASEAGGRDIVAVLWWRKRAQDRIPDPPGYDCDPMAAKPDATVDQLIPVIRQWSQDRLQACIAYIGFSAMLRADLWYPSRSVHNLRSGGVRVVADFHTGEVAADGGDDLGKKELAEYVTKLAADAMKRSLRTATPLRFEMDINFAVE